MKFVKKLLIITMLVSLLAPIAAVNIPKNHPKTTLVADGNNGGNDYEEGDLNTGKPKSDKIVIAA